MSASTTPTAAPPGFTPKLWVPGDWNAFFGFGTNILVNMLVLTGLLRFVLKMPDELVFGRILPAVGLMMALSTGYYAWLAYRLAKRTGRSVELTAPGGKLTVEWRDDDHVILTGPAEWEFSGSFDPATGTWARDTESAA